MESPILSYSELGNGKPLIILHGLFGTGDNWISHARKFAESYRVILPDARNHGHSFRHNRFDYQAMVDDVFRLMDHLGIQTANIIGHSMGGKTAMLAATQQPSRVNTLTVVDISVRRNKVDAQAGYLNAIRQLPLEQMNSRTEVDQKLAEQIPEFGIRQFLLKSLTRNEDKAFEWRLNIPVFLETLENIGDGIPEGSRFYGPTLFVRGGASNYIRPDELPHLHEYFPSALMHTIEDAGHWVHADKPDQLFETVSTFLAHNA